MGSFDSTCMVSDVGISYGDPIYAMLISNGVPISPLIPGTYADYGLMEPTEEPTEFLEFLKGEIKPTPAGKNPYHEQEVDPSKIDSWETLSGLIRSGRVLLNGSGSGGPVVLPYAALAESLKDSGILVGPGYEPRRVYIHTLQGDIHAIELPWSTKPEDPLIEEIREAALRAGYGVMTVPQHGRSYADGDTEYGVSLIAAPTPGPKTFLWDYHSPSEKRVEMGYIRVDIAQAYWPDQPETLAEMVEAVRKVQEALSKYTGREAFYGEMEARTVFQESFYFGSSTYSSELLYKQLRKATPESVPLWHRLSRICEDLNGGLRRGIRVPMGCIGSQCASEDFPMQHRFNKTVSKVLREITAKNRRER